MTLMRFLRPGSVASTALLLFAGTHAFAATDNYFGSTGALNGAAWSTSPNGPYTSSLTPSSGDASIHFDNGASFTGGSITVSSIAATKNATDTTASGTISNFNNGVVPIDVAQGVVLDFNSQTFTSSNTAGYAKEGAGTLALAGGSYGGGFTLNAGTVVARGTLTFGKAGSLTINGGVLAANANRTFDSTRFTGGIDIRGDFAFGSNVAPADASANLTFANNVTLGNASRRITAAGTGTYTFSAPVSGGTGVGLEVAGSASSGAVVVLSGANTYTGPTVVTSGILQLQTGLPNNISASPLIQIRSEANLFVRSASGTSSTLVLASGQTLAGDGAVSGSLQVAQGSTVTGGSGASPADSAGTLSTGKQTWDAGGAYAAKFTTGDATATPGVGWDKLAMSTLNLGTATKSNPFIVKLVGLGAGVTLQAGQLYAIATFNTAVSDQTGVINALTLTTENVSVEDGGSATLSFGSSGGTILYVQTQAAPEPATAACFGLIGGTVLLRRRRRERKGNLAVIA